MDEFALAPTDIIARLPDGAMNTAMAEQFVGALPDDMTGLVVYGSRARADFTPTSDLDALALVEAERGTVVSGDVRVSCYTTAQLESASGTLFGFHLQRDGVVMYDVDGLLAEILSGFAPVDTRRVFERVRDYSVLLDPGAADLDSYLIGVVRLGRYLLRSALYASSIAQGRPCFSVRELAERQGDAAFVQLLSSHEAEQTPSDERTLVQIRRRLSEELSGDLPPNPFGSIAALATREWDRNRNRSTLAILAMSNSEGDIGFDYSELPKVLL